MIFLVSFKISSTAAAELTKVEYTLIKFSAIVLLMEGLSPYINYFAFSSSINTNAFGNVDKLVNLASY